MGQQVSDLSGEVAQLLDLLRIFLKIKFVIFIALVVFSRVFSLYGFIYVHFILRPGFDFLPNDIHQRSIQTEESLGPGTSCCAAHCDMPTLHCHRKPNLQQEQLREVGTTRKLMHEKSRWLHEDVFPSILNMSTCRTQVDGMTGAPGTPFWGKARSTKGDVNECLVLPLIVDDHIWMLGCTTPFIHTYPNPIFSPVAWIPQVNSFVNTYVIFWQTAAEFLHYIELNASTSQYKLCFVRP